MDEATAGAALLENRLMRASPAPPRADGEELGLTRAPAVKRPARAGVRNSETGESSQRGFEIELLPLFDFGGCGARRRRGTLSAASNRTPEVAGNASSQVRVAYEVIAVHTIFARYDVPRGGSVVSEHHRRVGAPVQRDADRRVHGAPVAVWLSRPARCRRSRPSATFGTMGAARPACSASRSPRSPFNRRIPAEPVAATEHFRRR